MQSMQSMQKKQIMQKNESFETTYTHTQAVLENNIFNLVVGIGSPSKKIVSSIR